MGYIGDEDNARLIHRVKRTVLKQDLILGQVAQLSVLISFGYKIYAFDLNESGIALGKLVCSVIKRRDLIHRAALSIPTLFDSLWRERPCMTAAVLPKRE